MAEPGYDAAGSPIEVVPVVVLSQVFTARPSSIPDIRDFVRRCLAESPLTDEGTREVGETVFRALLKAAGPTGSIQVAFRIFPEHVEVDVLHSDQVIQPPTMPGPPVSTIVPAQVSPSESVHSQLTQAAHLTQAIRSAAAAAQPDGPTVPDAPAVPRAPGPHGAPAYASGAAGPNAAGTPGGTRDAGSLDGTRAAGAQDGTRAAGSPDGISPAGAPGGASRAGAPGPGADEPSGSGLPGGGLTDGTGLPHGAGLPDGTGLTGTGFAGGRPDGGTGEHTRAGAGAATFAEWMSSALRREGLTQEAAARQLGVSVKTVSRWVGGATEPRMRDLRRIQELFGEVPIP